jgi:hypothetical protein
MTTGRLTVLILGGYGSFGGRLARLLADDPQVRLIVAGRSLRNAEAFCAELDAAGGVSPAAFDRDGDVVGRLRELSPDIVVDASGPFQNYGDQPYRVVEAALALGINYLDLSDGSAFVQGIARFDSEARSRAVFILSGVSSFPVLTAAVVRRLAADLIRLDTVVGGIAPSPHADVGMNVIRALAGYAGKPVAILRDGFRNNAPALIDARRFTISPPGRVPLPPIRFTLVDVPDLTMLPSLWPSLRAVWMGAGLTPAIWHRVLGWLAWLVRLRLVPSLSGLAPLMAWTSHMLSFGAHRGGMFVAITGVGPDHAPAAIAWHLLAEGDDGPFIPSMAATAIIRCCADGRFPVPGARAATTELELADYEGLFRKRQIATGIRRTPPQCDRRPLYWRLLDDAWFGLPEPLRTMHDVAAERTAEGMATVDRGSGHLARLTAWLIGFPPAGRDVPVMVTFRVRDGRELWLRRFGGSSFTSTQEQGQGRFDRLVCERFGPLAVGMAVVVEEDRLRLTVQRWSLFGIPMPRWLAPDCDACEYVEAGQFHFDVAIGHPLTGPIVRYRGWLAPRA